MNNSKERNDRPRRPLLRGLLVLVAGMVLVAVTAEIGLRLFWPQIFQQHPPGMYTPHSELGHVLTPAFEGVIQRAEFEAPFVTNDAGLRGEPLRPVEANTFRILCLGDSFVWGFGVTDDETYPARLEEILQQRFPERDIQVLNGATPQYGTLDELAWLRSRGPELVPDLVILHFNTLDDFEQNRFPSSQRHVFRDDLLWYEDSYARSIRPFIWRQLYKLKHQSHLVRLLSERAGTLAMRAGVLADWEQASSSHFTDADAASAHRLLVETATVANELGAPTLLLYSPEKLQVLAGAQAPLRDAQIAAEAAGEAAAAFLDLTDPIATDPDPSRLFFREEGLWTAAGHELVARQVAEVIADSVAEQR